MTQQEAELELHDKEIHLNFPSTVELSVLFIGLIELATVIIGKTDAALVRVAVLLALTTLGAYSAYLRELEKRRDHESN